MKNTFENIADFKTSLISDPELQAEFRNDPAQAVQNVSISPLDKDKWIYRIVVIALGATILLTVIGVLILIGAGKITNDQAVPTIITALGSAAIGAIGGLLAPPPRK
nr:hypothetical protein [uncultured Mucilaginibacter sp.]